MLWWTLRKLKSANVETRLAAIRELETHEDARSLAALEACLASGDDAAVRVAAVEALGRRSPQESIQPLLRAFRLEEEPAVCNAFGRAFLDAKWFSSSESRSDDVDWVISKLEKTSPAEASKALAEWTKTKRLKEQRTAFAKKEKVRALLRKISEERSIYSAKMTPTWKELLTAAPDALDALVELREDLPALALARLGDSRAIPHLVKMFLRHPSDEGHYAARSALQDLNRYAVIGELRAHTNNKDAMRFASELSPNPLFPCSLCGRLSRQLFFHGSQTRCAVGPLCKQCARIVLKNPDEAQCQDDFKCFCPKCNEEL